MLLALTVEKLPFGWNMFKMCVKVLSFLNFLLHWGSQVLSHPQHKQVGKSSWRGAFETHPLRGYISS